jgi:hypothetical protein
MAQAALSLASSVLGGLLVLAGQYVTRRAEDRRQWRIRLHEAAADLATSYSQERARLQLDRRRGASGSTIDEKTFAVDRQRALARFRTLPGGSEFEPEIASMAQTIEALWAAWDASDDQFEEARENASVAVRGFAERVRNFLAK